MPLFVCEKTGDVVRANRHLIGHPCPVGFRAPTAAEVLAGCRGDKRAALVWHAVVYAFDIGTVNGSAAVMFLRPGDWVVRFTDGRIAVIADHYFLTQFAPKEFAPPPNKGKDSHKGCRQ